MKTNHTVVIGDSRRMREVGDQSVHLIITSPPYWQLKDYGGQGQIGFNDTYEDYINNLNLVWNECHRVLLPGCRLCINIGDQFARSVYYGRYKIIPIRTEIIKFCETIGFDYMGAIIWQKVTTCNTSGGATIMGSFPYPRNGIVKLDYEFILLFKKLGEGPKVDRAVREQARMTTEEWNTYFAGHWLFSGEKQDKHLAMFPLELPHRLIRMFSFPGEVVLDPFLGSGTTALAAARLRRNSIGYEANPAHQPVIRKKLRVETQGLFTEWQVEFVESPATDADWPAAIKALPYVFRDPIKINKQVDPRQLTFGSRISTAAGKRQELFVVKEVLSPERVVLNNGLTVRLLGIREKPDANGAAVEFLRTLTRGQKVFLKFDKDKYDRENTLQGYLYLENRTFINAHLIKKRLAEVDTSVKFRYRHKFITTGGRANG